MTRRVRARVEGVVQGVGYRPFVYRLAGELGVDGWVLNDARGVLVEAQGDGPVIDDFVGRLATDAPPLATVERVLPEEIEPVGVNGFEIRGSEGGEPEALVVPDAATCPDCLAEVDDPADRRHGYPFANCTNCGPRFTIVTGVPYDRPQTTMAGFAMCRACQAEYDDPGDRRFHAQPNACPECGPSLSLPLADVARALDGGQVVALKGLGGYHLACRADHQEAAAALRARKHREDKPFALMAGDLDSAAALVELTDAERELLTGRERPIVIARRRADAAVAEAVAPRSPDLGVMLPYTPLHHLLLAEVGAPLVMTSANVSDEPIAYRDDDARERLGEIADLLVSHDRPIHIRTDDSVVRSTALGPLMLRRSRGYVPGSLELPVAAAVPITAYGAELKSTICVAKGARAWPSHHIGDLENWETLRSFREAVEHFERVFAVEPQVLAHDLHPEYLSTKEALDRTGGVSHLAVQHHHAHMAACLAEHGRTGPALGVIYDGTGYGSDGTVWGGELLAGDLAGFERAAHLWPVRLPGGERAIKEPWRMACAWLTEVGGGEPPLPATLAGRVDEERWSQVAALCRSDLAPITTSAGRLCDAVAALCGVRTEVTYEGQAAIELEALATGAVLGLPGMGGQSQDDGVLDGRELVADVVAGLAAGSDPATVAARFHASLAASTAAAAARAAGERGLDTVVLSGGVFQNRLLLEQTASATGAHGLQVLRPELLPPNDGGISYGQAAVVAATLGRPQTA